MIAFLIIFSIVYSIMSRKKNEPIVYQDEPIIYNNIEDVEFIEVNE